MFDVVHRLKYSNPDLWAVLKDWPVTVFLPAVLLLIASLAFVTSVWDRRGVATRSRGATGGD